MYLNRASGILLISLMLFISVRAGEKSEFSEKALTDFGLQIQNSLASKNPYYFNISFDTDQLLSNVFEKYGQSPDESFHQGFIDGIRNNLDLGSLLVEDLSSGGNIELISVRSSTTTPSLIFRLVDLNGINYHEYFVSGIKDNYKITDVYIYSSGQLISESVGELYISSWFNIESEYSESIKKIDALRAKGKYKKAYQKWNKLSLNAKAEKSNLLTAIDLSPKVGDEEFYAVFNLFSLRYPDEPGKYLIPIEGLIACGLYETALENIDSLDHSVQYDPILNFVRANIYYEARQIEKAEECLNKLIETMPAFELGYFSLLDIYLKEDRFNNATGLLNQMISVFRNYKEDYIPLFANYPEFVDSPEYEKWVHQ